MTSIVNSSTTILNNGDSFNGKWELNGFSDLMIVCDTDQNGTITANFSLDGVNTAHSEQYNYTVGDPPKIIIKANQYFKIQFLNNSGSNQTFFRLKTFYGDFNKANNNEPLPVTLYNNSGSNITTNTQGHLNVDVNNILPFGSIHTENLTPVIQIDGVYGLNENLIKKTESGSGSAYADDALLICESGTTIYSQAVIQSRQKINYRAGQGVVVRYTARFSDPVPYSYQISGIGNSENGFLVGYGDTSDLTNTSFGILYSNRGIREIRYLEITTPSSHNENITLTLNNVPLTIPITIGTAQKNAFEIYKYINDNPTGWTADLDGPQVHIIRGDAGPTSGTYSISGTSIVGNFTTLRAGQTSTEQFINQANFNVDKLDGTGPSGMVLNPQKGNIYEISYQYLGFGRITFKVVCDDVNHGSKFIPFHTIMPQNNSLTTHVSNPAMPFLSAVYSAGSTSNLKVYNGSFGGFVEGKKQFSTGSLFSYSEGITTFSTALGNYRPFFTIMNKIDYNSKANNTTINVLDMSASLKHSTTGIIYIIKNADLTGGTAPNFQDYDPNSSSVYDNTATVATVNGANSKIIWTSSLGATGQFHIDFNYIDIKIQAGESLSFCGALVSGSNADFFVSCNTFEEQ